MRATLPVILLLPFLAAGAAAAEDPEDAYFRLLVATCYTCHSAADGREQSIPDLRALPPERINELLRAFRADREPGTVMNRISKALTDAEIDRLSAMLGREAR